MTARKPRSSRRYGTGSISWDSNRVGWRARTAPLNGYRTTKLFRPRNRTVQAIGEAEVEAHEWLDGFHVDVSRGTITGRQLERSTLTLSQWATEWLAEFELKVDAGLKARRTLDSYRSDLRNYVLPTLGNVRLKELDGERIEKWLTRLAATPSRKGGTLSDATVVRAYRGLHKILGDARLGHNPCGEIEPPRIRDHDSDLVATWEPFETNLFIAHVSECERSGGVRLFPVWLVAARCGLRRSELLALRWRDVDLTAGAATIRVGIGVDNHQLFPVPRPKGRRHRTVDVDPVVVEALSRWKENQEFERIVAGSNWRPDPRFGDLIFTMPDGRPVHPNSLSRWFGEHVAHLDGRLPRTTLHQLRHASGSALLAAGVQLGDVARRLGHSQQVLEKVYAKELAVLRDESRVVVLDAIEKLWGNGQS